MKLSLIKQNEGLNLKSGEVGSGCYAKTDSGDVGFVVRFKENESHGNIEIFLLEADVNVIDSHEDDSF
ncbi:hypothetical protein VSX61_10260 [Brenneria populi subsp. brevivirga]|uniref:hypothetical protein n=1 Tax=Brenneria populi TaxID=1505588 RepID=UPI002E191F6A|nr:hypothetical protein [Brenneria populi subsp. brevivirga]